MADYVLIGLIATAIILAVVNIIVYTKRKNYKNVYNYMYTGLNKDYPRCNCQGAQTVPTWGGNVETMAKTSPLNPGVGI